MALRSGSCPYITIRKTAKPPRRGLAAKELHDAQQQLLSPAPPQKLTRKGALNTIELGMMWPLMTTELKQEAFAVFEWEDLPKKLKLEFFYTLEELARKKILTLAEPQQRETATRKVFYRIKQQQAV